MRGPTTDHTATLEPPESAMKTKTSVTLSSELMSRVDELVSLPKKALTHFIGTLSSCQEVCKRDQAASFISSSADCFFCSTGLPSPYLAPA